MEEAVCILHRSKPREMLRPESCCPQLTHRPGWERAIFCVNARMSAVGDRTTHHGRECVHQMSKSRLGQFDLKYRPRGVEEMLSGG